tara:strand:- start:155 stop:343 length:189 start_codon:yes stop_codon:yes gene_type:complete
MVNKHRRDAPNIFLNLRSKVLNQELGIKWKKAIKLIIKVGIFLIIITSAVRFKFIILLGVYK